MHWYPDQNGPCPTALDEAHAAAEDYSPSCTRDGCSYDGYVSVLDAVTNWEVLSSASVCHAYCGELIHTTTPQ